MSTQDDIITNEVIRNYLESVASEVIETMYRTAYSPIFNEAHDCSSGVFYYDGEEVSLVSRAHAVPVHIYAALSVVEECLEYYKGDIKEGDVMLISDPSFGGSHIADYTVVYPVFHEGKPTLFPSVRGHMQDIGGPRAGGMNIEADHSSEEGFRFGPIKIYRRGEYQQEVVDALIANNRIPDWAEGDIDAMVGACELGERRLMHLLDRYGGETVLSAIDWIQDKSEEMFREEISQWPDGVYEGSSYHDDDHYSNRDIEVSVAVEIEGDEMSVDFAGSDPPTPAIINSFYPNTLSYVYMTFSALCPQIPINSGFFRPVDEEAPSDTVVNPPSYTGAADGTVEIGTQVGEAMMDTVEDFLPEEAATISLPITCDFYSGMDDRQDPPQPFVGFDYHPSPMGDGGKQGQDGWGGWPSVFCSLVLSSIEVLENVYPLHHLQAEWATDTAAPGQWRGVPAYWMMRLPYDTDNPMEHEFLFTNLTNPLKGREGGDDAAGSYGVLQLGADSQSVIPSGGHTVQGTDDVLFTQHTGGGGYGDPFKRDPQKVLQDVRDEFVSIERAKTDYGVVIDSETMEVDQEATIDVRKNAERRPDR